MITDSESVRLIFGLKVRSLRQQKSLSYQQLAETSGITISYLHDIENGKKYPKADKILSLAKALGSDYDYLVSLTGDKKIQPIIELISSDFINVIPWGHFGLSPATLLDIFSNTPDKITAFISTLVKISRAIDLTKDNFYTSALRSYQDIHNNYFEDLEIAANSFREQYFPNVDANHSIDSLERVLLSQYGIAVDRKKMGTNNVLHAMRSYYSVSKKILFLNKQLTPAQETFLLAREIGFQHLDISLRPYETILQHANSFDLLLNNFKASYFSAALLIPESDLAHNLQMLFSESKWQADTWMALLQRYNVSAEMLFQRLTNILPKHFNMDQLFFLRFSGNEQQGYEITKELHLSQLHNPHANSIHEHYCRRWLAVNSLSRLEHQASKKNKDPFVIDAQISHYWQTQNRYLCITMAKPKSRNAKEYTSVTLGLLLDSELLHKVRFVNDANIPTKTVHTTCERCSIEHCIERSAAPTIIERKEREGLVSSALEQLDK